MSEFVEECAEILGRTPAALRSLLEGLSEAWLGADEGPGTFSPRDVLGHLVHGEAEDWIPRLRIVLTEGPAHPFTPFDRWRFRERCAGVSPARMIDAFGAARLQSLSELAALEITDENLVSEGTHPDLGRVTARQLLATWVVHDLSHLAQIARVLARRYGEAVGPWRTYLPILTR